MKIFISGSSSPREYDTMEFHINMTTESRRSWEVFGVCIRKNIPKIMKSDSGIHLGVVLLRRFDQRGICEKGNEDRECSFNIYMGGAGKISYPLYDVKKIFSEMVDYILGNEIMKKYWDSL